jgi:hypothetical protein
MITKPGLVTTVILKGRPALRELQAADPSTRACSAPNSKQSRARRSHSQVTVFEKLPQAASARRSTRPACLPA